MTTINHLQKVIFNIGSIVYFIFCILKILLGTVIYERHTKRFIYIRLSTCFISVHLTVKHISKSIATFLKDKTAENRRNLHLQIKVVKLFITYFSCLKYNNTALLVRELKKFL